MLDPFGKSVPQNLVKQITRSIKVADRTGQCGVGVPSRAVPGYLTNRSDPGSVIDVNLHFEICWTAPNWDRFTNPYVLTPRDTPMATETVNETASESTVEKPAATKPGATKPGAKKKTPKKPVAKAAAKKHSSKKPAKKKRIATKPIAKKSLTKKAHHEICCEEVHSQEIDHLKNVRLRSNLSSSTNLSRFEIPPKHLARKLAPKTSSPPCLQKESTCPTLWLARL